MLVLSLHGCGYINGKKAISGPEIRTSYKPAIKTKASIAPRQNHHLKEINEESLNLARMLQDVLLYANKHKNEYSFQKKLRSWNFAYAAEAVLSFGHLFSLQRKHLIVKRMLWGTTLAVDVFLYGNHKFKRVCSQYFENNTFVKYLIKDVDGDNAPDFLMHWYPSSGCCIRDVCNVCLQKRHTGVFTGKYRFINATFSPFEKIIRGVGYGHPGDVQLYKFKWDGLKVDTIEFIFPDTISKKFHVFKHWNDFDNRKAGKFLAFVPKEYHNIEGYDWFKGIY